MVNSPGQGRTFGQHLRSSHIQRSSSVAAAINRDFRQWPEYWNDAESVATNLRRFEHWLQRARAPQR